MIFGKPFKLYAAGGSRGLKVYRDSIVLDLADQVSAPDAVEFEACLPSAELYKLTKPEYSVVRIPWSDGSAPWKLRANFWQELAEWLKQQRRTVIVCCIGGHGRTGTAVILLTHFLRPDLLNFYRCPVKWLRKQYCEEVVETNEQINYIETITNRVVNALPSWTAWIYADGNRCKESQYPLLEDGTSTAAAGTNVKVIITASGERIVAGEDDYIEDYAEFCNVCHEKDAKACYNCAVWKDAVGEQQPIQDSDGRSIVCQDCYDRHVDIGIRDIDCSDCALWNNLEIAKQYEKEKSSDEKIYGVK